MMKLLLFLVLNALPILLVLMGLVRNVLVLVLLHSTMKKVKYISGEFSLKSIRKGVPKGDWNLSELEFVRIHFYSELEFVRIGICQN